MAQENRTSGTTGLPGWLIGLFWSVIGVVVALLTIIILISYFLWLLWWGGQAGSVANQGSEETVEQVAPGDADGSATGQSSPAEQAATATAVQLNGTAASTRTLQASDQSTPASTTSQSDLAAGATPGAGATEPDEAEGGGSASGSQSGTAGAGEQSPQPEPTGSTTAAAGQENQSGDQPSAVSFASTGEPTVTASPTATPSPISAPTNMPTPTATNTPTPTAANTPPPTSTTVPTPTATNTPTPTPMPPEAESQDYVVQTDDTLSRLADKFYDDPLLYPAIVAATNARVAEDDSYTFISDPDVIDVGQKLRIPTLAEAELLLAGDEE